MVVKAMESAALWRELCEAVKKLSRAEIIGCVDVAFDELEARQLQARKRIAVLEAMRPLPEDMEETLGHERGELACLLRQRDAMDKVLRVFDAQTVGKKEE